MSEESTRAEADPLGGRGGRRAIQQMVIVGLIASALGIALGLAIDWFPVQGTRQAGRIDTLWDVLIICSVPVFVLVTSVVLFAARNFRMRPGEEHLDGPPIHGNTKLEVVWTAIPAIMLVSLCSYAYLVLHDIEKAPASGTERNIAVHGQQFTWTFDYNEGGKKFSSAQLYVPAGQSVHFDVRTRDVLHDFWVPAWRMKIDAVPGITTSYRVTPTRVGTYPVVCAELCGLGHAFMRQTAHVLPKAQFDAWVAKMTKPAAAAPAAGGGAAPAVDAKALFTQGEQQTGATACGACHKLADAGTAGGVGPDLNAVLKGKDAAFIRQSILQPDAQVAPGFSKGIMPSTYGKLLSKPEIDAMVKYLEEVAAK
ncbi:MAG: cytochrome c oxidase subunit [Baekduia sp.]|jgi:cytochrome c oxidase subunit 2|nr:cytochrome c oxidase subunit [Baekduia sp.]